MEVALIILLVITIALLALIVALCASAIGLMREYLPTRQVVYKASNSTVPPEPEIEEQEEELEEDETVPIEQFKPDFTKPIRFKTDIDN